MLSNYLPILIFLVVAAALAAVLLDPRHRHRTLLLALPRRPAKRSPYECGFEAFEDTRTQVRRALLPGGDSLHRLRSGDRLPVSVGGGARQDRLFGLVAMGIFLGILVVGFIYEWKKGALEWD